MDGEVGGGKISILREADLSSSGELEQDSPVRKLP